MEQNKIRISGVIKLLWKNTVFVIIEIFPFTIGIFVVVMASGPLVAGHRNSFQNNKLKHLQPNNSEVKVGNNTVIK